MQIKKNRLIFVREKGEEDELEEFKHDRISAIEETDKTKSPRKKLLPVLIVSGTALITIAIILTIIYFHKQPEVFTPAKDDTLISEQKKDLPKIKTENTHLENGKKSYYKGYYNEAIAEFLEVVESDASDKEKAVALTYIGDRKSVV